MRNLFSVLMVAALSISIFSCQSSGGGSADLEKVELKTLEDTILYGLGAHAFGIKQIAEQFNFEDPDLNVVYKGLADAFKEEQLIDAMAFNTMAQAYFQEQQQINAEKDLAANAKYLEENGFKDGVVTTESGLQYKIIKEGEGESPKDGETVTVNYEGKLLDGTVFDSSYERGEPASFNVNQVIAGWTEALKMMKPGSEWELTIPSDLAYGTRGQQSIPPNSVLLFKVELLSIGE